jgi:hypothetical protein
LGTLFITILKNCLSSPPVFSGFRVTRSLVLYICFVDSCLSFCTFSFGHCVVRYTDFDCPFGICKLFLLVCQNMNLIATSSLISSSCSTSDTRRVNLVPNPVICMNEESNRKCLRQVEHIRGHLWHRYSITVNQVVVATVKLSK